MVVSGANSELPRKLFRDSFPKGFVSCRKHDCLNRESGRNMERLLLTVAEKINSCDEASLTALWEKYHARVADFEATGKWEQAVLVLTILQGVRWKNRLFNHHLAGQISGPNPSPPHTESGSSKACFPPDSGTTPAFGQENRGKVLRFRPRKGDKSV